MIREFPGRLRELRKENHLTQKQVADRIGVSKVTVSNYETGERTPGIDVMINLANYFQVSLDYLVGRTSQRNISVFMETPKSGIYRREPDLLMILNGMQTQLADAVKIAERQKSK